MKLRGGVWVSDDADAAALAAEVAARAEPDSLPHLVVETTSGKFIAAHGTGFSRTLPQSGDAMTTRFIQISASIFAMAAHALLCLQTISIGLLQSIFSGALTGIAWWRHSANRLLNPDGFTDVCAHCICRARAG